MLWVRVPPGPLEIHCPRGTAWSARLPVTQEIAGSNPVEGAIGEWRRGTQSGQAQTLVICGFESRLRHSRTTCDDWALASPTGRNPAIPCGFAGSTPARRTEASRLVRLSVQDAGPSSRKGGFNSRTGRSRNMTMWWNWQTRDAQIVVPFGHWEFESPRGHSHIAGAAGAQLAFIRPVRPVRYRGLQLRVGQCSARPHKPGPPGATPGPATTGYANWHSGEVESLVPVGSTPTSVTQ